MFNFKLKALAPTVKIMERSDLVDFIEENDTFIFYTSENELFHVLYHGNAGEYLIISSDSCYLENSRYDVADRIEDLNNFLMLDVNLFAKNISLTIE